MTPKIISVIHKYVIEESDTTVAGTSLEPNLHVGLFPEDKVIPGANPEPITLIVSPPAALAETAGFVAKTVKLTAKNQVIIGFPTVNCSKIKF